MKSAADLLFLKTPRIYQCCIHIRNPGSISKCNAHNYIAPLEQLDYFYRAMRSPQTDLFSHLESKSERKSLTKRLVHGGEKSKGKRKTIRPLATKKWIHLVLKSDKARGKYSMLAKQNSKWIDQLIKTKAKKFGIELKEFVNMGNHIHFQLRIPSRKSFQAFLRSITNLIARHVTGARKGKKFGRFWQGLAFTRVLTTAFEVTRLQNYFVGNRIEKQHGKHYRERYLTRMNSWMKSLRDAPS